MRHCDFDGLFEGAAEFEVWECAFQQLIFWHCDAKKAGLRRRGDEAGGVPGSQISEAGMREGPCSRASCCQTCGALGGLVCFIRKRRETPIPGSKMQGRRLQLELSSEVETASRQENPSNQESGAPFLFNRNGKGSRPWRGLPSPGGSSGWRKRPGPPEARRPGSAPVPAAGKTGRRRQHRLARSLQPGDGGG